MSELDKIIQNITVIPKEYEVLLDSLFELESGSIHHNETETNITNGYGIYRAIHKDALVFKYIDTIASKITNLESNKWRDNNLLDSINNKIDPNIDRYLSYIFYKEYLKDARLHLFDSSLSITIVGLYSNTPVGMWKSVQEGLRDLVRDDILPLNIKDLSIVDGNFGEKTERALLILKELETTTKLEKILITKLFKKSVLLAMKSYYANVIDDNPVKHIKNIVGWNNRIEELEHT